MTLPFLLFALLLALILGAFYHFIRDGGPGHLLAFLVASAAGFAAGHGIGAWRGWVFFVWGPYNFGMEVIGAVVFLILTDWLLHLPPRTGGGENEV